MRTDRSLGLDPPCRIHRILAGERSLDVERGEPALGQRRRGDLDEDALVLRSQQIDLGDAGNAQQDVARGFAKVFSSGIGEALAGDGVERDVGVAELVVEEGTDARPREASGECRRSSCEPGRRHP